MFKLLLKFCRLTPPSFTGARFGVAMTYVLIFLCVTAFYGGTVRADPDKGKETSIKILNLLHTDQQPIQYIVDAFWAGVNAALYNISAMTTNERKIEFINLNDSDYSDLPAAVEAKLQENPDLLAILGPFMDNDTATVLKSDIVKENNLVCLSPFGSSINSRGWTPNAFFTRADPSAEIILLARYVVNILLTRRIGIMFLTGSNYGTPEADLASTILRNNDPECNIIYYAEPHDSDFSKTAFMEFAKSEPQTILIFGEFTEHTREFVKHCLMTEETDSAVLLGTLVQQDILTKTYFELVNNKMITPKNGQVITSGTNLMATDIEHYHTQIFREQMTLYNKTNKYSMKFTNENWKECEHRFNEAEIMVSGWITGSIIAQFIFYETWIKDRKSLQENIFNQNRFVVYRDHIVGDYGGSCSRLVADQGAICNCNQGGHTVILKKYHVDNTISHISDFNYTYPVMNCKPDSQGISMKTVSGLVLRIKGADYFSKVTDTFVAVAKLSQKFSLRYLKLPFLISINSLNVSMSNFAEDVLNYTTDYHVSVFSGPTTTDMPEGMLMINPFFRRPRLSSLYGHTTITIMPTIEQQLFVLLQYLSDSSVQHKVSSTKLTAVVRSLTSDESRMILDAVDKSAFTFRRTVENKLSMVDGDTLTSGISSDGFTLLMGLDEDDVHRIADHLRENPDACVVLIYRDFSMYYDAILTAFEKEATSVQARLMTITNLPLWTDYSSETHAASEVLSEFHTMIRQKEYHTPGGLEIFIVGMILSRLMAMTDTGNDILRKLYTMKTVVLDGLTQFGPYNGVCDQLSSGNASKCTATKNYGARNIYMLSMERVLKPSVANDYPAITPDIFYSAPDHKGALSARAIAGITVGCAIFTIAFLILLLWLFCKRGRDNSNAPNDMHLPVTLIFTDIESSTALWATLPQLMPRAVAMHHKLIRGAIAKHKCYEVKTVGDSFMIACKDAYTAVQVASEIQLALFKYKWGTDDLDKAYREFERRRQDEDIEYKPPTALLPDDEYSALWSGLRVRIGIHTGLCDIRYDRVTSGIDYYGETSNMAARTEAIGHGGQILLTECVRWSLSHQERASLQCESLGPQRLRGVPYPVEIYQLNTIPGRQHAALRTELDVMLPVDDRSDMTSNDASALLSSAGTIAGPASAIATILTNCFSPFSVAQRIKGLQPVLQKWNIVIPQRSTRVTDEDYCQGMISRLAIRMASVAQMRQRLQNGDVGSLPNSSGRRETAVSNNGIIAPAMMHRRRSTMLDNVIKANPLSEHFHSQSPQKPHRVVWSECDDDGAGFDTNESANESFRSNHYNTNRSSFNARSVGSDSIVSIHIQMPLDIQKKHGSS